MLSAKDARWTIRLTLCGAAVMLIIVGFFYAADHKGETMRIITAVNPIVRVLPRLTENWRLNQLNVRLYDGLVVLGMAAQGLLLGAALDAVRFLRRGRKR